MLRTVILFFSLTQNCSASALRFHKQAHLTLTFIMVTTETKGLEI
jgi:hypothetical protein